MQLGLSDFVKKIIAVLALLISGGLLIWRIAWTVGQYNEYKAEIQSCEEAIARTQVEIQSQQQTMNDVAVDKQEAMANFHQMGNRGVSVAALQSRWTSLVYQYSICQEGEKALYEQQIDACLKNMREYFETEPFGWYAYRGNALTWKCATNYAFYTESTRVVWLCQSVDVSSVRQKAASTIYAYVTADYSYKTEKFSNVQTFITSAGEEFGLDREIWEYPLGNFNVLDSDDNVSVSHNDDNRKPGTGVLNVSDENDMGVSSPGQDVDGPDDSDPYADSGDDEIESGSGSPQDESSPDDAGSGQDGESGDPDGDVGDDVLF